IVLYDDGKIYFGCNYKDCSKEMTFAELEEANVFSSDISAFGAPKNQHHNIVMLILILQIFTFCADWNL
ncbi:MAG: hypothetical protein IJ331_03570, partial [Ruminococcus sp.]|nr:hypothetical protein [Ruminococcus sp.]